MSNQQLNPEIQLFLHGLPVCLAVHEIIESCVANFGEQYASSLHISDYLLRLKYPNQNRGRRVFNN